MRVPGEGGSGEAAKDSVSVSVNAGEETPTKPKTELTADDRAKQLAELQREIAYLEEERHLLDNETEAYEVAIASLRVQSRTSKNALCFGTVAAIR